MSNLENLLWWHSDQEVVPSATAHSPWTHTGTGLPVLVSEPTGVRMVDTDVAAVETYTHQLIDADSPRTAPRADDDVWFQITITGTSATPGWASGASPIGFWIDDGHRALAVSVGDSLRFVDPYTGAIIATALNPFPWLTTQTLYFWKSAADRWMLWVDGKLMLTAAYASALPSPGSPATAGFGSMSVPGVSSAVYEGVEVGVNRAIPPQWKVDRTTLAMPAPMQARWTTAARAAMRTTLGMIEAPLRMIEDALFTLTAARLDAYRFGLTGEVLPSAELPAWADLTPGNLSIVRERLRLSHDGLTVTGARAVYPAGGFSTEGEYTARAEFTVRAFTVDAQGRVGPHIQIFNGDRVITAQLLQVAAKQWVWRLTNGALAGAVVLIGAAIPTDILQRVRVEVQVLGRSWVLLLLNDVIVDRVPYQSFPASGITARTQIACQGQAVPLGPICVVDVENAFAVRRLTDLGRRPAFLQNAVERLIFVGGCERNDELDTWMRHHQQVEGFRGTTQGITIEMRRLSCNEDTDVVAEVDYGDWYLEVSYPEVTPIWLEFNGTLTHVFVEFGYGAINFTPQQLADLAAQYLVPTSVVELAYSICYAVRTTGISIVPAPGTTRFPVVTTAGFAVGDAVTIRNPANTVQEDHAITALIGLTHIETDETSVPFAANSRIRKVLATT